MTDKPLHAYRRLVDQLLTADDWARVYLAYQGFLWQIRLIVQEVLDRQAASKRATP